MGEDEQTKCNVLASASLGIQLGVCADISGDLGDYCVCEGH